MAVLLVLVSTGGQLIKYLAGHDEALGLISLTFVGNERNFPTLFSVFILAFAALCCAVIAVLAKKRRDPDPSRWAILSFGFLYLAFDEALSLHERLSVPVRALLGSGTLGFRHSFWTIPAILGSIALGLFFLGFLLRLPAKTRFLFLTAAFLFIGGAAGMEIIGGNYAESHGGDQNLTYAMIATVEESLEMGSVILFIYALLAYIAENYGEVRFQLGDSGEISRSQFPGS